MPEQPPEIVYSTSTGGFADPAPRTPVPTPPTPPDTSPSPRRGEATLGARARDGDVDAFEDLLRAHQAELDRVAFRMRGDRDQAQEVVVATLLEGWRRISGAPRSMSFRIWMSRTAMRRCLTLLSAPPTGSTASASTASRADTTTDGPETDPGDRADLDVALDALSPAERACWVLKELHGMSDVDISHAMGVPQASVGGRVSRARQHLVTSLVGTADSTPGAAD